MTEFKVGDRVQNISDRDVPKGDCGTVVCVCGDDIGIEWDKFDEGHNFMTQPDVHITKPNHGYYVLSHKLKLLNAPEISIKIEKDSPYEIYQSVISALENHGVGLALNGNTLEVTKEIKNMRFKTEEGFRIDKTCNKQIPTIKTTVSMLSYPWHDGVATCDKADYSERQGVIEALANLFCDGNFDREFNKAVKANVLADKKARTCSFCGKVFDTVEKKAEHEAWHIERKKARRERYLLRKRAKEIAFEEAAQKMAKDMLKEKPNE